MASADTLVSAAPSAPGRSLAQRAVERLKDIFGIDLRTLALVRIALGAVIIADLVMRARDLRAFYTDAGVLPRAALLGEVGQWSPSLHLLAGSATLEGVLFVIAGVIALALIVGYKTRLATILSWVFLLSLQARNPALFQGGDHLLYLLLFWAMFLPLGARFSVDAALDPRISDAPDRYCSMATAGFLIQAMIVYFFGALLKTDSMWLPDGTAVYFALHLDHMATPLGILLRPYPTLLQGLTYYVMGLELLAPFIMFSPVWRLPLRLVGLALLIPMHIGFFLLLQIALFAPVSITSLLAFTPGWAWDRMGARLRTPERTGVVIYYDEPCEFCRKVCLILRTFLLLPETPILPAQSDPGILADLKAHNSWVVVDHDGSRHVRWNAIALVFRRSALFAPLGWLFARRWVQPIGERIYETVARNRGRLGAWSAVALPYREMPLHPSRIAQVVVALLIGVVLAENIRFVTKTRFTIPFLDSIKTTLRLGQGWTMFAPSPSRTDGWFVAEGRTVGGAAVDPMHGRVGEPDWARPKYLASQFVTYRWERYMMWMLREEGKAYRPAFAQYLCRHWNQGKAAGDRLADVKLYFNMELIMPDYLSPRPSKILLETHHCDSKPAAGAAPAPATIQAP